MKYLFISVLALIFVFSTPLAPATESGKQVLPFDELEQHCNAEDYEPYRIEKLKLFGRF